ncbi:MAG: hypothetical protein DMG88_05515 [Acidobacteria bacterium]|nr:MAG: hypothetical protein DMG88_05515 [Acidobacteriota bacterium]
MLYNFGSKTGDPLFPDPAGIIAQGHDGNLYSTTPYGGAGGGYGNGTVFRITPSGTLSVINQLQSRSDSGLTLATDGNFYGAGDGGIFKVTRNGNLTKLFPLLSPGGFLETDSPPIQAKDSNFYGNTSMCESGDFVYKFTPSGTTPIVLHTFSAEEGFCVNPLVQGSDGNLYGTALRGGTGYAGTVFKITPSGKFTLLFTFPQSSGPISFPDGNLPNGPLTWASDGNLYGTAEYGGTGNCLNGPGCGVVFKITPSGSFTVLHSFTNSDGNGVLPQTGLVQATDGNLYGTTSAVTSSFGCGTIFRISLTGTFHHVYTLPHDKSLGCTPLVPLVQHTNGLIYGDTIVGGTGTPSGGVFFKLNANLPLFVSLLPYSGKVGKTIEFLGQGFTLTSTVSFSGAATTPTLLSSTGTYLTATVPNGATTGFVTVTTSGGALKSNKIFRVTPQITSFTPTSGLVGASVTITGVSLKQTTKVTFGGVKAASFTVDSDTRVTATVPRDTVTGSIAITTAGGTATSSGTFTVD